MKKLEYTIGFVTPAFLGSVDPKQAQWRTPPFKTMLRQWWRLLKAGDFDYDPARMREAEADLFGSAAGDQGQRSKLWLRLLPEEGGATSVWSRPPTRPLAKPTQSQVYIGYGPVQNGAVHSAIPVTQTATLSLIMDNTVSVEDIQKAVALCHRFATLGARSRNGWGSLSISGDAMNQSAPLPLRDWEHALDLDWPHAIGECSGKPLIWETGREKTWEKLMDVFSTIRKERVNKIVGEDERPTVSYPVTKNNHFGGNYRLPSQLVFKARRENGNYVGTIVHLPHRLPDQQVRKQGLIETWEKIHRALDHDSNLQRTT